MKLYRRARKYIRKLKGKRKIVSYVIRDRGENNSVDVAGAVKIRGRIIFKEGSGNRVVIGPGASFSGFVMIVGKNNLVEIGPDCDYRGRIVVKGRKQRVTVGKGTKATGVYILSQERCNVTIGKGCLLSRDIEIRTTDAHSVVDRQTGIRTNLPGPVVIGEHVWIGVGAIIGPGVTIPPDSIVGALSFVNKSFTEEGTLIAGTPAKIVKRGITWQRSRKPNFTPEELDAWREA